MSLIISSAYRDRIHYPSANTVAVAPQVSNITALTTQDPICDESPVAYIIASPLFLKATLFGHSDSIDFVTIRIESYEAFASLNGSLCGWRMELPTTELVLILENTILEITPGYITMNLRIDGIIPGDLADITVVLWAPTKDQAIYLPTNLNLEGYYIFDRINKISWLIKNVNIKTRIATTEPAFSTLTTNEYSIHKKPPNQRRYFVDSVVGQIINLTVNVPLGVPGDFLWIASASLAVTLDVCLRIRSIGPTFVEVEGSVPAWIVHSDAYILPFTTTNVWGLDMPKRCEISRIILRKLVCPKDVLTCNQVVVLKLSALAKSLANSNFQNSNLPKTEEDWAWPCIMDAAESGNMRVLKPATRSHILFSNQTPHIFSLTYLNNQLVYFKPSQFALTINPPHPEENWTAFFDFE